MAVWAKGSTSAYCQPVEDCTTEVLHTLAFCQVYQAAADSGEDAFAAAVEQHGAPAVVRAGAASGGVDISAYGFAVVESDESEDDEIDVQEELRQLRSQIGKAVTFGQAYVPSASSLSFAGVSAGPQQQVVPRHGGAATAGSDMWAGHIAHVSVPTEEFPGGVDLVPVRHAVTRTVPSMTLGASISAVSFSLDAAEESFVEPEKESGFSQLDVLFMGTEEEEEFTPSIYEESFGHPNRVWLCLLLGHGGLHLGGLLVPPPPSPDYDPEEEEQLALNGDHGSARNWGFYIDDRYGVDITGPLHRTDNRNIADFFTRPLPPQARFYDNPSFYGIEPNSEGSNPDSGYGSGMDEVD
ncbi:hypothetical protein CYMTET_7228 [Cymbomonas tetramitiformis]|uniref:Uncharacterized protein n=1 Tax=Cymbomonas tetramitiformis TaxID=36881 RepID=A0AAE0LHA1_9CHLO|nr:hypothetical protein CYMTET_7228 [Cymbomonas tetramitiformis]